VLLIAGAPELGAFRLPAHVDTLTLPPLVKTPDSEYVPRNASAPTTELIALRSEIIRTAVKSFSPDVFIADKLPRGLLGELDPTLRDLHATGRTRSVLGLRDILDHPLAVRREWTRPETEHCVPALRCGLGRHSAV
jgi:predicted glycosyltransferase